MFKFWLISVLSKKKLDYKQNCDATSILIHWGSLKKQTTQMRPRLEDYWCSWCHLDCSNPQFLMNQGQFSSSWKFNQFNHFAPKSWSSKAIKSTKNQCKTPPETILQINAANCCKFNPIEIEVQKLQRICSQSQSNWSPKNHNWDFKKMIKEQWFQKVNLLARNSFFYTWYICLSLHYKRYFVIIYLPAT